MFNAILHSIAFVVNLMMRHETQACDVTEKKKQTTKLRA